MPSFGGTVISGSKATTSVLSQGRVPDRSVDVSELEPNSAPLVQITTKTKGRKRRAINTTFEWFEDEPFPYWDAVNYGSGYNSSATSVVVDNGSYFGSANLVLLPRTGEIVRVSSVSSNTLTITRAAAGSTAAAIVDGDDLRIIGSAHAEGATAGTMKATKKSRGYNYTQIFRDTFGATGTEEASELYWGNDRTRDRKNRGVAHALNIEAAFLFGQRDEDTSGSTPIRTTRGVLNWITTNTEAIGGFISEDAWNSFLQNGFLHSSSQGKNSKWFFGSRAVIGAINGFARDALQVVPKDKTYGISVQNYTSFFGDVLLMAHNLLENNPASNGTGTAKYGGYGILMDPQSPTYRFLAANGKNRDTKLRRDIQANDADSWQDEYLSEIGMEYRMERWSRLMTGVTG